MRYVNKTYTTKTFYGVEFKPEDEKDVPGAINVDGFFRTDTVTVPEKGKKPAPIVEEQSDAEQVTAEAAPKRTRKTKESES